MATLTDVGRTNVEKLNTDEDGTAAAPAITLGGDLGVGFYRAADNQIGIVGDQVVPSGSQIFIPDGSASNPAIALTADPDTGLYSAGVGDLTFAVSGGGRMSINAGVVAMGSTTVLRATAGSQHGSTDLIRKTLTVAVSATELRTLAASPKALVAAPGAGVALIFRGCVLQYRGGANVFDSVGAGEDLAIRYTDGSGTIVSTTVDTTSDINFGALTDDNIIMEPVGQVKPTANAALVLDNVGAGELASTDDDSDGDGTVEIILTYDEVTLAA